jgi:hypothetical protein
MPDSDPEDSLSNWPKPEIILYHGTLESNVDSICDRISLEFCKPFRDFGRGFYTTTFLQQAHEWANTLAYRYRDKERPAVLQLKASRDLLAELDCLWFVRSEEDHEDYWNFVRHCRTSDTNHGRTNDDGLYDIIVGPVAQDWEQRAAYPRYDQASFHTQKAIDILNGTTITPVTFSH